MSSEPTDLSKKRFIVTAYEIQQEIVDGEEFSGQYSKTVTLSDGTTRTIELTPVMRNGRPVFEFKDTGHRNYMGMIRVRTGRQTNGNLMVQIVDLDDVDAARAEWRSSHDLPASQVPPRDSSLVSMPEFVPPGFTQGIEILNDNTTPMKFVVDVLSAHLGLSPEDSNQTMLAIHTRGGALIPTPSLTEAQRIAALITAETIKHNYPLICRPVSIGP